MVKFTRMPKISERIFFPDKASYLGEYNLRDGVIVREGTGEFTYADGSTYSGSWLNDRPHGEGLHFTAMILNRIFTFPLRRYCKLCRRSIFFGKVRSIFRMNIPFSTLFCSWVNGLMHHGTLRYASGDIYVGNFELGKQQGSGSMEIAKGQTGHQIVFSPVAIIMFLKQAEDIEESGAVGVRRDVGNKIFTMVIGILESLWLVSRCEQ